MATRTRNMSLALFAGACALPLHAQVGHLHGRIFEPDGVAPDKPWRVHAMSSQRKALRSASAVRGRFRIELEGDAAETWIVWAVKELEGGASVVTYASRPVWAGASLELRASSEVSQRLQLDVRGLGAWGARRLRLFAVTRLASGARFERPLELRGRPALVDVPPMPGRFVVVHARLADGTVVQTQRFDVTKARKAPAKLFVFAPRPQRLRFTIAGEGAANSRVRLEGLAGEGARAVGQTSIAGSLALDLPNLGLVRRRFSLAHDGKLYVGGMVQRGARGKDLYAQSADIHFASSERAGVAYPSHVDGMELAFSVETGSDPELCEWPAGRGLVVGVAAATKRRPVGVWVRERTAHDARAPRAPLAYLGAGKPGDEQALDGRRLERFVFDVRDASGRAAPCPSVWVRTTRGELRSFTGSSRGRLVFRGDRAALDCVFATWDQEMTRAVAFHELNATGKVELRVQGTTIRGRVLGPDAEPVGGATVSVKSADACASGADRAHVTLLPAAVRDRVTTRVLRSASDGSFELRLPGEGELWRVHAKGSVGGVVCAASVLVDAERVAAGHYTLRLRAQK